MRFESWMIAPLLIILVLSAFVGLFTSLTTDYSVNVSDQYSDFYDSYELDSSNPTMQVQNYTGMYIEMTNDSQTAKLIETDYGADAGKSQTNIFLKAWNFFSDLGGRVWGVKNFIITGAQLLGLPPVLTYTILGIIVTLLMFASIRLIFGSDKV